jgi:guanylate kinase
MSDEGKHMGSEIIDQRKKHGNLFVVSAPSGSGKTTLCKALLKHYPDIVYSISTTTREPREGEKDGVDYHFMEKEAFIEKLNSRCWAEWALVHDHYYGTSAEFLNEMLLSGKDILLDIDVQGMRQILEHYPDAVTIFIMPPSLDELRNRLEKRGTDNRETIEKRLGNAEEEISSQELYRYVIINDRLEEAINEFIEIVGSYIEEKK